SPAFFRYTVSARSHFRTLSRSPSPLLSHSRTFSRSPSPLLSSRFAPFSRSLSPLSSRLHFFSHSSLFPAHSLCCICCALSPHSHLSGPRVQAAYLAPKA